MVWVGFVDLWGFKCTFCHDFEGPAIQCCNFCSFMIFICICLCFCNPNSKSMAWRKQPEPMKSDPCLLTFADWHLAKYLWPMAIEPWTINPELWALSPAHGPWALGPDQDDAIMSKSTSSWTSNWFPIQKPNWDCNIDKTVVQANLNWNSFEKIMHSLAHS